MEDEDQLWRSVLNALREDAHRILRIYSGMQNFPSLSQSLEDELGFKSYLALFGARPLQQSATYTFLSKQLLVTVLIYTEFQLQMQLCQEESL